MVVLSWLSRAAAFSMAVAGFAVAALMLGGVAAEAALDCRGKTPLPDDLALVPPAADVPERAARFAGAWNGAWLDAKGDENRCQTLVVEEVLAQDPPRFRLRSSCGGRCGSSRAGRPMPTWRCCSTPATASR